MNKKQFVSIILLSVIFSLLVFIFFGSSISAKISTLPLFRRWKLVSPQAPIVINRREEVRVSDSGDVLAAVNKAKSQISTLVTVTLGRTQIVGTALNLTADGVFVVDSGSVAVQNVPIYIVLNDGRMAKVESIIPDRVSPIAFVKASMTNVPVANLGNSKDVTAGDKLLFINGTTLPTNVRFQQTYAAGVQRDIENQLFDADFPSRSFSAQALVSIGAGTVVVNTNGEVVGVWGNNHIVSSDVLKNTSSVYFANNQRIIRPHFGFSYTIITKAQSVLLQSPEGALVKDVEAPDKNNAHSTTFPAHDAGLLPGDIITKVDESDINENFTLEEALEKYKPFDRISCTVIRNKQNLVLSITPQILK